MKKRSQFLFKVKDLLVFAMGIFMLCYSFASCTPEAVEPVVVSSATVSSSPDRISYYEGDALDLSGLVVELLYSDDSKVLVAYPSFGSKGLEVDIANGTILAANNSGVKITHTESGKSCTQPIAVSTVEISGLVIKSAPAKISYYEGDALSLEGLVVTVSYNNGTSSDISYADFGSNGLTVSISDGSVLSTTDTKVVVSSSGGSFVVDQPLTISAVEISILAIKSAPTKISYYVGDALSLEGLVVTVSYNNGTSSDISYADFGSNGLTVSILDGAVLSFTDTKVLIMITGLSFGVAQELTVELKGAHEPEYSSLTDSRDGKVYKTVTIGDQVWMAENLAYTGSMRNITEQSGHYEVIEDKSVYIADGWSDLESDDAAYCYYNNDSNLGYGCLYTWYTAMGGSNSSDSNPSRIQGICPSGWHLPSDSEWDELENYLISNGYNYDLSRHDNRIAKSIASKTGWDLISSTGAVGDNLSINNSSGFSALPGGYRGFDGFHFSLQVGCWWSSTQGTDESAHFHKISYVSDRLFHYDFSKNDGYSVRCVRD